MQIKIADLSWSYSQGILSVSGVCQVLDDNSNVIHQDSIHTAINTSWTHDWYPEAKAQLLEQCRYIVTKFVEVFTVVEQKTGQTSIENVLSDVTTYLESNLNGGA